MTGFEPLPCIHDGTRLSGRLARPQGRWNGAAVLMFPGATGPGPSFDRAIRELAAMGYLVVSADMYEAGADLSSREAAGAQFAALMAAPGLLRDRTVAWFRHVRGLDGVDPERIAAIGYCFGGKCVLELARSGEPVRAISSFHGLLATDAPARPDRIQAEISIWTGGEDPYVPQQDVEALQAELDAARARYQVTRFAKARHAFTDPDHDGFGPGIAYDRIAHRIAWMGTLGLLAETVGEDAPSNVTLQQRIPEKAR
ncbi:MAG: dienelactone hydrolase family protein [Novosphingobium sp.]|uniref:dienelactone hydrolase family protein n=1 Tax=Novosphingobium sp. TaxID=1874826 RepID=UPI0012C008E2|nr:dienelactone hydrolase family protein [Novosphingobium sp.]MPS69914.1 dienelactone hydrolase family protein [Novosphingobium sp.]